MMKYFYLIMLMFISRSNAQVKFCNPVNPNIDQNSLPQLPQQFQTRIEMNILNQLKSQQVFMIYDYNDRRCEMVTSKQNKTTRNLYYFDRDELFTIDGSSCRVSKLSQSGNNNLIFGIDNVNNQFYPKPPSFVLHFNNGFPMAKLDDTEWRGIKVSRYQSCQDWPEMKANVLVDYYFKVDDFASSISFDNIGYKVIPVAAVIEGYSNIDQTLNTYIKIKHQYNYYEFRPFIERTPDLYTLPDELYCEGYNNKQPIPPIPSSFSLYEQAITSSKNFNGGSTIRFEYSSDLKATRQDLESALYIKPFEVDSPIRIVNDFYSGVGYGYLKKTSTCVKFPLTTSIIDQEQISTVASNHISLGDLKSPNELFGIDDSYNYLGQRYERGILCDVWVSKRNESILGKDELLVELFMLNKKASLESNDRIEYQVPISRHISNLNDGSKVVTHFFDFDSSTKRSRFDISDCFEGKEKVYFAVRFEFTDGLDKTTFDQQYGKLMIEPFYQSLLKAVDSFELSPLRIIPPRIISNKVGFTIYSGFTATAESKYHFKRTDRVKIDTNKIKVKLETDSSDKCADICLNKNEIQKLSKDSKFICRSFDSCKPEGKNTVICSFYNNSTQTDPDLILNTAEECSHYSKVSQYFDTANINDLYRIVEESVVRNEFTIELKNDNGMRLISFNARDFYKSVAENEEQLVTVNQITSSYLTQFRFKNVDIDYDEAQASKNSSVIIYKKTGVLVDECARLCITENSFDCQSFSYANFILECKWSSISFPLAYIDNTTMYVTTKQDTSLFMKDSLANYIEYPYQVTSMVSLNTVSVTTIYECANLCNKETKIKCRSFNYCNGVNKDEYKCLLSETNINNNQNNPNNVYSAICTHYSKKAINDYQIVPQTQLGIQAQTTIRNTTVERCAEQCYLEDGYFCRSFDFFMDRDECNLYKENIKDKPFVDLKLTKNQLCNHYSRLNYEENGVLKQIQPSGSKGSIKYGGGTIFGVIVTLIIGGLLIGVFSVFVYFKAVKKQNLLPVMEFINPNFSK